eukprot:3780796-Amphidinium_carterae.1
MESQVPLPSVIETIPQQVASSESIRLQRLWSSTWSQINSRPLQRYIVTARVGDTALTIPLHTHLLHVVANLDIDTPVTPNKLVSACLRPNH